MDHENMLDDDRSVHMTALAHRAPRLLAPLLVGMIMFCCLTDRASGMTYSWNRHPQKERIVFAFADSVPALEVARTGPRRITLTLPESIWEKETRPAIVDLSASRMITQISSTGHQMTIELKSPSFGFIYFPDADEKQLIVDIFRDPLGARWQPPQETGETEPPVQQEIQTAPDPNPLQDTRPRPLRKKITSPEPSPPAPVENAQKQPGVPQTESPNGIAEDTPPSPRQADPGTLRFKVKHQTVEEALGTPADRDIPQSVAQGAADPSQPDTNISDKDSGRSQNKKQSSQPPPGSETNEQVTDNRDDSPESFTADGNQTETPGPAFLEKNATNATAGPNFKDYMITAKAALQNGEVDAALEVFQGMLNHPEFPDPLREESLYLIAEALFQKYHSDLTPHFQEVMSAFQRAVNFNPESQRLPSALLSMGMINLKVDNVPEATGYFQLIRSKFPNDSNVPLTYYYMGEHYLDTKEYQQAADNFQYVIQNHPDTSMVQSCAIGLTKALKELGYFKQAFEIMDYAQKRWPRYYIQDPEFLMLAGYIELKNDHPLKAKENFWTYINLTPEGENVDIAMARIGDIHVMTGKKQAAREVYEKTAHLFPDREGGLIAKMRLAEEGVFDQPSISKMFSVFDKPYSLRPKEVYTQIIEKYPQSPLAPVARLKLAMWQLWSEKFKDTLQTVSEFVAEYSKDKKLLPKALEVGNKAFSQWIAKALERDRYQDIIAIWESYPFLHASPEPMSRLAVATSFWKTGDTSRALDLAEPFLSGTLPQGPSSGPALDLVLAILVQSQSWQQILDMTQEVKNWELSDNRRRQFEYTLALAHENLEQKDKSAPLWKELASEIELPDSQRAYALYFMAKQAERTKDLENEYLLAQQALSLFLSLPTQDLPKIRDCLNMLIQTTSRTGRTQEALGWGLELEKYIDKDDPSWAAHMYTLAGLFKLNRDMDMWQKKLTAITQTAPDSIYSKMAARDLEAANLDKKIQSFK
ncbi:tetratricopeptide repeat protein [Desulfoplanes sp. PS50]